MPDIEMILHRLESKGNRLTGPRRTVLEEVLKRSEPFTSAELCAALRDRSPRVGRATIFRTVELLARLGVLQRIHRDAETGRCHAFLACDEEHHHHLICNNCGAVTDFSEHEALASLVAEVEKRTRFRVEGHRLELVGVCPSCQQETA